ncbi:MAG TPA: tRNA 2-thiouridine(34) synthase MnmA [Candidatus Saccharimonadales bacterium]|nr:tRNA 2-thiouridine(34) synthase MnmA [Candidatus Saccharimonadales bacterium]
MKTVYVGLSGGVDSSVTAALLKQQSYRVVGVYMKNWTQDVAGNICPWQQDLADARAVAAKLDIAFKVFDFQDQYKHLVVDYMIAEYQAGRTPNPDIMCNQEVKFALFLKAALADGADLIATGHYARIKDGQLLKGLDPGKDQSYFLCRMPAESLGKVLMPIGEYHKAEVRKLAAKFGLPTAKKPDSQGICFVGEIGVKDFLSQYVQAEPGPIKLLDGTKIGQHEGAIFYTLGQRKGLGVGGGKPYYVTSKDMTTNTVYVTDEPRGMELFSDEFEIENPHLFDDIETGKRYQVLTRHMGNLIDCTISKSGGIYVIKMDRSERAVTPGQSAVIYDGDRVVGSGIISSAKPALATHNR